MTLASCVFISPILLYFVHVVYIAFDSKAYRWEFVISYLNCWPAVRTDYWTDLIVFLLKIDYVIILSHHDKILYCLKSICIIVYMYKVSYPIMLLYLSIEKDLEYLSCVVLSSKTQRQWNKSRVLLFYLDIMHPIWDKGKIASNILL